MSWQGIAEIAAYMGLVTLLAWPLGAYMARIYTDRLTFLAPVERVLYKLCGINQKREQHWTDYALACLAFNLVGVLVMYGIMRLQDMLPLNPAGQSAVPPDLALNTAVSFATNTNWQNYGGESTMSYLTQMMGMNVHNFTSAATGMAVLVALVRGFARKQASTLGNFYVDATRSILYVLLPLAMIMTVFLVWQGVPQNLDPYAQATTLEGAPQVIAQGPVASQIAIKQLGTNGGGFFNANSAHPYENPTAVTNLAESMALILLAAALVLTFGRMIGEERFGKAQGRALYAAMAVLLVAGIALAWWAEQSYGNLEGKEARFGIVDSVIWAAATTASSNGSVNAMHDSFTPLGGMVPLVNMMLGEVVFGGVGSGLHGMIVDVILAVFIAGLMVGRTPEYLGKKIEAREIKLAVLCLLVFPLPILVLGGLSLVLPVGLAGISAPGPHGLTQVLYAFTSTSANNGSAFGGLSGNTPYYNLTMAVAMLIGRFLVIIPTLAIAGAVAAKKIVPASGGTFPTHSGQFVGLLIAIILIIGGLTFFPVLALGPIAEHLMFIQGTLF